MVNHDNVSSQTNQYLAFIETTANWFRLRANRFHWFYNATRTLIIALSLSIPLLSTEAAAGFPKWVIAVLTTVIAILAALDGLFKPGEMWRHFRFHQLALLRLLRTYNATHAALESHPASAERDDKAKSLFENLVADTEKLLEEESAAFWPKRIQPLKTEDRPET